MARVTSPTDLTYLSKLENTLSLAKSKSSLYKAIVNAPFRDKAEVTRLGLGIIELLLVNQSDKAIKLTAISQTYHAAGAVKASEKPFKSIVIPLDNSTNLIAKAINTGKPQSTYDWQHLFIPALSKDESRYNQDGAAIVCSEVWPLKFNGLGALIFSYYSPNKLKLRYNFMDHYTTLVSSQLLAK